MSFADSDPSVPPVASAGPSGPDDQRSSPVPNRENRGPGEPGKAGPQAPGGATSPTQPTTHEPTTTAPTTPPGGCPDARSCDHYRFAGKPWATDAEGRVRFPYWIHPDPPPGSSLTPSQVVAAIRAAFDAWTAADPKLQPEYKGTTADPPGNYNNVVGFGSGCDAVGCTFTKAGDQVFFGSNTTGFHVVLTPRGGWTWNPCDPAHGQPCSSYPAWGYDLQNVATHEVGHVYRLNETDGPDETELTMDPRSGNGSGVAWRDQDTLALGDVLGVRKLYPCDCPMPVIYRP
jgi:hypothetical protein